MPDLILEQYKEHLRAGHVAAMRGQLEAALDQYRQAAELAEGRAMPQISMGQVLLRLGRTDEALAAFSKALGRAPHDEAAITGRIEALIAAGRSPEAAEMLERLAEVQAASDREPEALASLERALTLAVTRRREKRAAELATRLGVARVAPAAVAAGDAPDSPDPGAAEVAEPAPDAAVPPEAAAPGPEDHATPAPFDESRVAAIRATPAPTPGGPPDLLTAPDPEAFFDEAEQAREAGQDREALALYVLASDAYARAGAREAALEVCQRALAISPDAPSVHLALVRLYLGRGWRERAIEKLTLLDRLLALGPASGARRQIATLAAAHANGDPRLLALASPAAAPAAVAPPAEGEVAAAAS
jgi:tetratricopeptide (TPR) repeat protein